MTPKQQDYQQGAVMALNGWNIKDIQTFGLTLNMPHDVTEQMIDGYVATKADVMTINVLRMKGIQTFPSGCDMSL